MAAKKVTQEEKVMADLEKELSKIALDPKPTKDLTGTLSGNWPGNPAQRTGSYYINLHKMDMKAGEMALLGAFPEGFVYERADVHGLEETDAIFQVELTMESGGSLGIFHINPNTTQAGRLAESDVYAGTHAEKKKNLY